MAIKTDLTKQERAVAAGAGGWILSIFESVDAREHSRIVISESLFDLYNATKGRGKNKLFSTTVFTKRTRKKQADFYSANLICLDIDKKFPVAEFVKRAGNLRIAAFATQSHLSYRYGEVQERYRVPVVLDRPITNLADYLATVDALYELFGDIVDQSCKDAARKFYFSHEDYAPLYINESGEPFKVREATEEHKSRADEILAGRKVDPQTGFNDAGGGDLRSVKIGDSFYFTDIANSKNYMTLKKVRKESILMGGGSSPFVWLPAAEPDFLYEIEPFKKNGSSIYAPKKCGIRSFDTRKDALYFVDVERDIDFVPGLRIKTPTGVRIWNKVPEKQLDLFRELLEKSTPAGITFREGTLDKMARCPVVPSEIRQLRESEIPTWSAEQMVKDRRYKLAVKSKRLREKRNGREEVFKKAHSLLAKKLARIAFNGEIPAELNFRNKPSEYVLRILLGSRSFILSLTEDKEFPVNIYTTAEAASVLSGKNITPVSVSRFLKKMIASGLIETDNVYKINRHSKRYKPTDKLKTIVKGLGLKAEAVKSGSLESLPGPTDGTFNGWVFSATRFADSEAQFLAELDRLYGTFMRGKEDRFTEAVKAWRSNMKRQIGSL